MKLTTFLAALAGLDFVTASPTTAMGLTRNAASALLKPRAYVLWDPPNAILNQEVKKKIWSDLCEKALDKHSCAAGIIFQGQHAEIGPDGERTMRYYHNVEEVPLTATDVPKRLRVYLNGTSQEGWTPRDRYLVRKTRRKYDLHTGLKGKRPLKSPMKGASSSKAPIPPMWTSLLDMAAMDGGFQGDRKAMARAKRKTRISTLRAKRREGARSNAQTDGQEDGE